MTEPIRKRSWLMVTVAVVVGIIVGVGVVLVINSNTSASSATPASTTSPSLPSSQTPMGVSSSPAASSATSSSTGEPQPGAKSADGCLGGKDPFAAVLLAQSQAPLTAEGAAAFARTVGRYSVTFPIDPDADHVISQIAEADSLMAASGVRDMSAAARDLRAKGYTEATAEPDKSAYVSSTGSMNGHVNSANVALQLYRKLTKADGAVDEVKMTTEVILSVKAGKWVVADASPPPGDLSDPVTPWVPYIGGC